MHDVHEYVRLVFFGEFVFFPGDLAVRAQSMISIANRNPYRNASRAWRMKNIFCRSKRSSKQCLGVKDISIDLLRFSNVVGE